MNQSIIIAGLTLIFTCIPTLAQEKNQYQKCLDNQESMNNSAVYSCASEEAENSEQTIQQYVQCIHTALKKEDAQHAKQFIQSQHTWEKYRDTHCALATAYIGSPMYSYCPMQMNEERAKQLTQLAESLCP